MTVSAGADAIVRLSMSVTIRALLCNATGIRVAVTFTLSILSGRSCAHAVTPAIRQATHKKLTFFIADTKVSFFGLFPEENQYV